MEPQAIVDDYLVRLEAAASSLPVERRAELIGDVRGHIELALAEFEPADEAAVRNVLERLGTPDEIAGVEAGPDAPTSVLSTMATGIVPASPPSVSFETIALFLLTAGAVLLPFIGPVLGLAFAGASRRWTAAQKRTAAMIVGVLLVLPAAILIPMAVDGEITAIFSTFGPVVVLVPLAGLVTAAYLAAAMYLEVTLVLRRR